MALQKIKSLLSNQEEEDRKVQKVNYSSKDRQYTLDEIETILSHYDFSDTQKQKIINLFSTKMGGDQVYKNIPDVEIQINSLNLYKDFISTLTKEIFHDAKNTYINYKNQEKMKSEISDILSVEVTQNNKETNEKTNIISSLFTAKEKIENPEYKGGVYFDDKLDTYEVYGNSYKKIDSKLQTPKIISIDDIAKKNIINIKDTDENGNARIRTYVKDKKNIIKIFKNQGIKIKTVETYEEATLCLKELFSAYKNSHSELWNLPNWFDYFSHGYTGKFKSESDLKNLNNIGYIDDYGFHEANGKIVFPVILKNKNFKNNEFIVFQHDMFRCISSEDRSSLVATFK